jgi:hypothetical protein
MKHPPEADGILNLSETAAAKKDQFHRKEDAAKPGKVLEAAQPKEELKKENLLKEDPQRENV